MEKVKVLIIDSGVDSEVLNSENNYIIDFNGKAIVEKKISSAINEHGNIIAKVIKSICNNVELYSICIFDKNLLSDGRLLIRALENALLIKPDILNLSIGVSNWRYFFKIKRLIKKLIDMNCTVVISESNGNEKSYLVNMKNVIKVKGAYFKTCDMWEFDGKFFYAPFTPLLLNINSDLEGNSIAAAYMSGHIANIRENNFYYLHQDIKEKLILLAN